MAISLVVGVYCFSSIQHGLWVRLGMNHAVSSLEKVATTEHDGAFDSTVHRFVAQKQSPMVKPPVDSNEASTDEASQQPGQQGEQPAVEAASVATPVPAPVPNPAPQPVVLPAPISPVPTPIVPIVPVPTPVQPPLGCHPCGQLSSQTPMPKTTSIACPMVASNYVCAVL